MAGVRSMLARVAKMESGRDDDGAAFAAFVAECETDMAAGKLDRRDLPVVLDCLRVWRRDYGVNFGPQRGRSR